MATEKQIAKFKSDHETLLACDKDWSPEELESHLAHELIEVAATVEGRIRRLGFWQRLYVERIAESIVALIRMRNELDDEIESGEERCPTTIEADPQVPQPDMTDDVHQPWFNVCHSVRIKDSQVRDPIYEVETVTLNEAELRYLVRLADEGWGVNVNAGDAWIIPGETLAIRLQSPGWMRAHKEFLSTLKEDR